MTAGAARRFGFVHGVILMAGVAAVVGALALGESPRFERRVFEGIRQLDGQYMTEELPKLTLTDLNGKPLDLDQFRGRVVFLNLWASWCKPCEQEVPSLVQLAGKMASEAGVQPGVHGAEQNREFVMVAVSWDENTKQLADFLRRYPDMARTMVLARDPGGVQTRILGTRLLPESYVIDQQGRLVARFQNVRDWVGTDTLRLLQSLIRRR